MRVTEELIEKFQLAGKTAIEREIRKAKARKKRRQAERETRRKNRGKRVR